ncbi:MAG: TetR/AcrR family transcriptional regulator [Acidimicrobiales bacterium]
MGKGGARRRTRSSEAGEAARSRILHATLETIRTEGMVGASARAIARTGGFNQASIYYHFGSVNDLVLAAVRQMSAERLARYDARLAAVASLAELARVGAELHEEDVASGNIMVLAQVLAGATGDPELSAALGEVFGDWEAMLTTALRRAVASSPLRDALPIAALAQLVAALFLGIELVTQLEPNAGRGPQLFDALDGIAALMEGFIQSAPPIWSVSAARREAG